MSRKKTRREGPRSKPGGVAHRSSKPQENRIKSGDVKEAREMSEILRKGEALLHSIYRAAPVGIGLVSSERVILQANDRLCKMLGYSAEELVGKNAREIYPSDEDYEYVGREKYRQIDERGTGEVETRWLRKDGGVIDVILSSTPIDLEDRSAGVTFTAIDITARKRAEEELRQERDRAQSYLDIAHVMLLALDGDGIVTLINKRGCEILDYEFEDEVVGKGWIDNFIPEAERDRVGEIFLDIIQGETQAYKYAENHVLCKNGEEKLIAWHNVVFLDGEGHITGSLSCGEDITELRKAKERMEGLNDLFLNLGSDIMENIDLIIKGAVHILECDFAAFCLYTHNRLSILSNIPGEDGFIVTRQPQGHICYEVIKEDMKGPVIFEQLAETPYAESDPVIKQHDFVSYLGYPVIVEGKIVGYLCLMHGKRKEWSEEDMETAGMLAQAISVEQERLDREEDLKDFIDVASHELRHPITIIKGYTQTLRNFWQRLEDAKREEILNAVEQGADRLNRLVKELLDVSRIERGFFPVRKEESEIRPLLESAVTELINRGFINRFNILGTEDVGTILVDPDRFSLLLSILLDNAAKYSTPGSEIDITVEKSEPEVIIAVMDRGMGVPEEERERIFERFYQVEDVLHHSTPGMGIGLYIAREIVEAHRGVIWCEPREGGGTIFRFTLAGD